MNNNKEAFEFLSQSENNVRHATREMLERYSIPEGDAFLRIYTMHAEALLRIRISLHGKNKHFTK